MPVESGDAATMVANRRRACIRDASGVVAVMAARAGRGRNRWRAVAAVVDAYASWGRDRRRVVMVTVAARAGLGRDRWRAVMVMVDAGRGGRRAQSQEGRAERGKKRNPERMGHRPVRTDQLAAPMAIRACNAFNTVGARPGKSSLISPGPNPSAQAA